MYKVIKAKRHQFLEVHNLFVELFKFLNKFYPNLFKTKNVISKEEFKKDLKGYYLLTDNNKIAGLMAVKICDILSKGKIKNKVFFVHALVVKKMYRYKHGGTFFINYVDKIKEKLKIDSLRLRVMAKNKIAYKFYIKNGLTKQSEILECKQKRYKENKNLKKYNIINAKSAYFIKIKSLMKQKENIIIDFYRNIVNHAKEIIAKKEFNNLLKDDLCFVIKDKGKIIAAMGASSLHEGGVFVPRDEMEIKFLFIDKNFKNKNKNLEKEIVSAFIDLIKRIAYEKNIQIIRATIYPEQKNIYCILKTKGFYKFSFDMEKKFG